VLVEISFRTPRISTIASFSFVQYKRICLTFLQATGFVVVVNLFVVVAVVVVGGGVSRRTVQDQALDTLDADGAQPFVAYASRVCSPPAV
jgi:hypothetical protein